MDHFSVYEHIRPDTGEVFYVGKGAPDRVRKISRSRRNPHHGNIVAKLKGLGLSVEVRIVADGLPEESALCLEKMRIAMWRAVGTPLTNQTDGGEGMSGNVRSDKTRAKISASLTGRKFTEEWRNKISEAFTDERRAAFYEKRKGHATSAETRAKIAASLKGKSGKTLTDEGRARLREGALRRWAKKRGEAA